MGKKQLSALVTELAEKYSKVRWLPPDASRTPDTIGDPFGLTISISDVIPLPNKQQIDK